MLIIILVSIIPKTVIKDNYYKRSSLERNDNLAVPKSVKQGNQVDILMPRNFQIKISFWKGNLLSKTFYWFLLGKTAINECSGGRTGRKACRGNSEASLVRKRSEIGVVWDVCRHACSIQIVFCILLKLLSLFLSYWFCKSLCSTSVESKWLSFSGLYA